MESRAHKLRNTSDCQEPPGAGKGGKDPLLELPEGAWPSPHLDFRLLSSRTGRESTSDVLSPIVGGRLLWQVQDTHPELMMKTNKVSVMG